MSKINVIVIPETDDFTLQTTHKLEAYTNLNLGVPQIDSHNAKYLAPYWTSSQKVDRLYEIKGFRVDKDENCCVFELGNSFVLPQAFTETNNKRTFHYIDLSRFGMIEIKPGILMPYEL